MTIKKILVPVDFSECSGAALSYALAFAKELGAEVEVTHAFEIPAMLPPHVVVMIGEVEATMTQHAEQQAKRQLDEFLKKRGAGPEVKRDVLLGPPALTVIERIEQGDTDLVIMGTHGRTGVARWFMGSTAEKVLRGAPCPVLTIRTPQE